LAALLARQGLIVLVAATAHLRAFRALARERAPAYLEVFVDVSRAELERRDPKGLYRAVREGRLTDVPGADIEYEAPDQPEILANGGCDAAALSELLEMVP
jgi:adenylylsulfate kinase